MWLGGEPPAPVGACKAGLSAWGDGLFLWGDGLFLPPWEGLLGACTEWMHVPVQRQV